MCKQEQITIQCIVLLYNVLYTLSALLLRTFFREREFSGNYYYKKPKVNMNIKLTNEHPFFDVVVLVIFFFYLLNIFIIFFQFCTLYCTALYYTSQNYTSQPNSNQNKSKTPYCHGGRMNV